MIKNLGLLIWASSLLTKVVYVYVGVQARNTGAANASGNIIMYVLLALGIVSAAFSIFLGMQIYSNARLYKNRILIKLARNTRGAYSESDSVYFLLNVLCLGFAETTALYGLVGYIQTSDSLFFGTMLTFSFLAWLFNYPKYNKYVELLKEV